MNYLITGSAGFIGYHLTLSLCKNKKNKVYGIDSINSYYSKNLKNIRLKKLKKNKNFLFKKINLINKKILKNYLEKIKPDYIIHLAGQPGVIYSFKNPNSYKLNNLLATKNLLEVIKKINLKKFILDPHLLFMESR